MKKRILLFLTVLMVICLFGCGQSKSKYAIDKPTETKILDNNLIEILGGTKANNIQEFIPMMIDWYNSVDISEPVSSERFNEAFYDKALEIVDANNVVDETRPITEIMWIVAKITMGSEVSASSADGGEIKITVKEEDWTELGDKIKNAVKFYFEDATHDIVASKTSTNPDDYFDENSDIIKPDKVIDCSLFSVDDGIYTYIIDASNELEAAKATSLYMDELEKAGYTKIGKAGSDDNIYQFTKGDKLVLVIPATVGSQYVLAVTFS